MRVKSMKVMMGVMMVSIVMVIPSVGMMVMG